MSKKTSACIRLIISLIAVVLLVFLLIMGISGRNLFGFNFNFGTKYSNADKYSAGNASFPADDLKDIYINWIDGEINVLPCEGNNIEIEETADGSLEEKQKVHYYYNNGALYIQYEKSHNGFIFSFAFSDSHKRNKSLTLRIPETLCQNLSTFELDTASSQNNINGISCSDMDIDNVSGETILSDVVITNKLIIDNVSGDVNLQGECAELDIDNVSGNCIIDTFATPSSFNFDTVSGDCDLKLPYSSEFSAEIDSVSGDINFNGFQTTKDDDKYICGNRGNEFDFDTVSGNVTITRKEQDADNDNQGDDNQGNDSQGDGNQGDDNQGDDNQDNDSQDDDSQGDDSQSNGYQGNGYQGNGYQGNGNYGHGYNHHNEDH